MDANIRASIEGVIDAFGFMASYDDFDEWCACDLGRITALTKGWAGLMDREADLRKHVQALAQEHAQNAWKLIEALRTAWEAEDYPDRLKCITRGRLTLLGPLILHCSEMGVPVDRLLAQTGHPKKVAERLVAELIKKHGHGARVRSHSLT